MTLFFLENRNVSGIFNAGSGKARTWNDLVYAIFKALDQKPVIEYIELPEEISDRYQYFTEADIKRIKNAGYSDEITSLENGVTDYIKNYLLKDLYLGY
jgi:ADP-L-glycero-D-manno-heptose 6-epimerase